MADTEGITALGRLDVEALVVGTLLDDGEVVTFAEAVGDPEMGPTETVVVALALLIGAPDEAAGGAPPAQ